MQDLNKDKRKPNAELCCHSNKWYSSLYFIRENSGYASVGFGKEKGWITEILLSWIEK